ncbi:hypothetical protein [Rummeliibacillus sp. POC4]|uniref:hypothetical protein n=1 Tax=Rummeliibacillus sp. POC4 TaxID=2305899 RepID=UPI000E66D50F|nr:hypothetical protein [Rummeliibacillus sp. POC4]RIJ62865.1 hypothetical protein D1606_17910 [Rummeliibacillus sp. POC4]
MQPGDVFKLNFDFEPPGRGSSYRPVIIMQVYQENAIAIKVTHSGPTEDFPYREKIIDINGSGLDSNSYAQYDFYNIIPVTNTYVKIGILEPTEFAKLTALFNNFHST